MKTSSIFSYCISILMIYGITLSREPANSSPTFPKTQPCSEPVTWRIGNVDSLFDINKKQLKEIVTEAGKMWSDAAGKELWSYSDSGKVAIHLIYSEEQKYTENKQELSDRINEMRMKFYAMKIDYHVLSNEYNIKLKNYNKALENYEKFVRQYKNMMSRWKNDSVIPREADDKMKRLKNKIDFWQTREEIELNALNTHIKKMQKLSQKLNDHADEVNELIYHYRENVEFRKTFHQAVYLNAGGREKINIYQFSDYAHLKLVLAHEIGHALGLKHVGNAKSVMFYLMEEQHAGNLKLSAEDIRAINERCSSSIN